MRIVKRDLRGVVNARVASSTGGDVQDGDQVSSEAAIRPTSRLRTATDDGGAAEERVLGLADEY